MPDHVPHPPGYRDGRLYFHDPRHAVLVTDFDVAAYTRNARGPIPVAADTVDLPYKARLDLEFLWRVETAALGDMRAMLASWTSKEARITAFLATWAYERYWNARALHDLLTARGYPEPLPTRPRGVVNRAHHLYVEKLLPGLAAVSGLAVGEPATAGHMARMAIHEGALMVANRAIESRLDGEAARVLAEIATRRQDMVAFYRQEAVARIQRSRREKLSARLAVSRPWSPLRPDGVADADERRAFTSLFGHVETAMELKESDAVIGQHLPGRPLPTMSALADATARRRNHGL